MKRLLALSIVLMLCVSAALAQKVTLKATADVGLSCATAKECNTSHGKLDRFKIKTIQEMAAIRFDATPAAGREVLKARLFLLPIGKHMLRYIRVSTVSGDWAEGSGRERYGPPNGATFNRADHASKRPWAWGGSQFCDVIMGSGNSLACWAEIEKHDTGWVSVKISPDMVYAMVAADTDGLAVMDGGTLTFFNNWIRSAQSDSAPYIEVELGKKLTAAPARPVVKAEPAAQRAHLASGAAKLTVATAKDVICWRVKLDGKPVQRWRVKHPARKGPTVFCLEDLPPSEKHVLEVVAVAPSGRVSPATKIAVTSSPALPQPPTLGNIEPPKYRGPPAPPQEDRREEPPKPVVLPLLGLIYPPLVKVSPETGKVMFNDAGGVADARRANAVWDGNVVKLFGARGEYVSYQVVVKNQTDKPVKGVKVLPTGLSRVGSRIGRDNIELYKCWYARNKDKRWQPAYCVPIKIGQGVDIPDPARKLAGQKYQSFYVDIYIPKDARPGKYTAPVKVQAGGVEAISVPVELTVYDFALPDKLSFWPQLNTYSRPARWHDYFRLAHNHRCVYYYRSYTPPVRGAGKDVKVVWDEYDRNLGPLLTGEAFAKCRRAGVPIETMALPFADSWPTPLTKQTYNYQGHWPKRGESTDHITAQMMNAPYIGDALSQDYKDAFLAAQKQFVEHFRAKGWNRTEMQCVFVGKSTHRTNYGINMWWRTDEPYHWEDWLALQFFNRLWTTGRKRLGASRTRWSARADISRQQWQGRVLEGAIDNVYFGSGWLSSPAMTRRCRILARENPLVLRVYGGASADNGSNTASLAWIVSAYLNGADAALPWQALGNDKALDAGDSAIGGGSGGAGLIAPGKRFGTGPVADMRLKAFRDGQQLAEYLNIVEKRYGLNREQVRVMVGRAIRLRGATKAGAAADNADALRFGTLKAWQISELRRTLAELIVKKP